MSKTIDIFAGINSFGIPYTNDNTSHIGYVDIIADYFFKSGYLVRKINLSNIAKNRTFDLSEILAQNEYYRYVRQQQYDYLKKVREKNKYIGKLIPEDYLGKFLVPDELDDARVTDLFVNSSNPVFLYAGGENDFMTYIGTGPMELVDKSVRDRLPQDLDGLVIKSVDCVEENWKQLISLNSNVMIFAYNMFYAPLYDSIQEEVFRQNSQSNPSLKYVNRIMQLIQLFNKELELRSSKYDNVEIVDAQFLKDHVAVGDFHQNFEGNRLLAQKTIERLLVYENGKNR